MKRIYSILLLTIPFFVALWIQYSGLDLYIQDSFYDFKNYRWIFPRDSSTIRWICYYLPKYFLGIISLFFLTRFILSYKKESYKKYRQGSLHVVLALALIPLVVAVLKAHTGISCPYNMNRYDGKETYYFLFEKHINESSGNCFPAGHASGGLSLIALYYALPNTVVATAVILLFSLPMGIYQVADGAHFVSHVFFTLWISIVINFIINKVLNKFFKQKTSIQK